MLVQLSTTTTTMTSVWFLLTLIVVDAAGPLVHNVEPGKSPNVTRHQFDRSPHFRVIDFLTVSRVDDVHSAVGPSLLGVRWLRTHYRTISAIHRSEAVALGVV